MSDLPIRSICTFIHGLAVKGNRSTNATYQSIGLSDLASIAVVFGDALRETQREHL